VKSGVNQRKRGNRVAREGEQRLTFQIAGLAEEESFICTNRRIKCSDLVVFSQSYNVHLTAFSCSKFLTRVMTP